MAEAAVAQTWLLPWLSGYRRAWLGRDVVAGLTAAAVVVPKAMAYAAVAGLAVQAGLNTVLLAALAYALLGHSRQMSVSTTTTLAILMAAQLEQFAPQGEAAVQTAAATLTVLTGAALLLARLLRFGFIANFISEPVLAGFKAGIGLVIVVDQLPKLLGLHFDKAGFVTNVLRLVQHLPATSLVALGVGAGVVGVLFALEHFMPKAPAPLLAIGLAIIVGVAFGLDAHGLETVGTVAGGLPAFSAPDAAMVQRLWPAALGLALMSFAESVAVTRAFRAEGEASPHADRELSTLGIANVASGLFGGMVAGGGTSQTAVNRRAGAQTQLAGLVTGIAAGAVLLFLAPVVALVPQAALGAVVIVYSIELVSFKDFRQIRAVRRTEFYWALVAFAGVVLLGTLQGILVAAVVSLVALAQQAANPAVYRVGRLRGSRVYRPLQESDPEVESFPGLLIVRPEGRLYFGNAQRVGERFAALILADQPRVVILDCRALFDLEYTALKMLDGAEAAFAAEGRELWLTAVNPGVMQTLQHSALGARLAGRRIQPSLDTAAELYLAMPPGDRRTREHED